MSTFHRSLHLLGCKKAQNAESRGGSNGLPWILFRRSALLGAAIFSLGSRCYGQAEAISGTTSAQDVINQLLSFIYSLGHLIGQGIVQLLHTILPTMPVPTELVDPIGLLAILTLFLAIASIAKKLVWIVVIAGWVLILIRLILVIIQNYL
jgi:hypothetical protein